MHSLIKLGAFSAIACFAALTPAAAQSQKDQAPAMKLSQAECQSLWNQADAAKSGSLSQAQAQPYVKNFSAVDANRDGKISRAEFDQGCTAGHVESSAGIGAGTGTKGNGSDSGSKGSDTPGAPSGPKM